MAVSSLCSLDENFCSVVLYYRYQMFSYKEHMSLYIVYAACRKCHEIIRPTTASLNLKAECFHVDNECVSIPSDCEITKCHTLAGQSSLFQFKPSTEARTAELIGTTLSSHFVRRVIWLLFGILRIRPFVNHKGKDVNSD